MKISLESERLKMVSLDSSDAEQFFDFLLRNKEYFRRWGPEYEKDYFSVWYHKAWLESMERGTTEGRQIMFGTYLKTNPNRIIATVSFSNIIKEIFQSCYLGYRVDENETKKGIASEAITRAAEYMFSEVKIHRIEANIMPSNAASIRVMEKLGFVNEGLSKKYLKINGKWEDHFHYVLLNSSVE
jgi:ribosomal-protein-alanine N-acetyltransferase